MTVITDNLPTGGTDDARTYSLDEAAALNVPELDDEEPAAAEPAAQQAAQPEEGEEGAAGEADQEDEGDEEGEAGADAEAAQAEPADTVNITVNGQKVAVGELKSGYMRQADYSRKTQEVAANRREVQGMADRVMASANAMAEFLARQIPDPPPPALAQTDPAAYVQRKAAHDAAVAQIQSIFSQAGQVKTVANTLTEQQHQELLASENAKLAEAFPSTSTEAGRKAFFDEAASAARDLGYSAEEIGAVTDHRMFALAHYAAIGFRAEQAKAKAAQKVANVPPVAQPKRQKGGEAQATRNREAMNRLRRSGSIEDAMAIDFD